MMCMAAVLIGDTTRRGFTASSARRCTSAKAPKRRPLRSRGVAYVCGCEVQAHGRTAAAMRQLRGAVLRHMQQSPAQANGWGSAGQCPASHCAKTPAVGERCNRVAAGMLGLSMSGYLTARANHGPAGASSEQTLRRARAGAIHRSGPQLRPDTGMTASAPKHRPLRSRGAALVCGGRDREGMRSVARRLSQRAGGHGKPSAPGTDAGQRPARGRCQPSPVARRKAVFATVATHNRTPNHRQTAGKAFERRLSRSAATGVAPAPSARVLRAPARPARTAIIPPHRAPGLAL
jgi:hypothetical protein